MFSSTKVYKGCIKPINLLICFTSLILIPGMTVNAQYHKELQEVAKSNHLIGMSVAVVCNDEIADIYHYGKANLERNIDINNTTLYRIASISKLITATALMILYDRKLFMLDEDISKYLGYHVKNPYYPDSIITFRMLLSHTSSIQDGDAYGNFLSLSYRQNPSPLLKDLLIEGASYYEKNIWQNKAPGSYFTYCNLNYGIIGALIEKISGERFDIFIKNEIVEPLSIEATFNVTTIKNTDNLATLYRNSIPQLDDYKGDQPLSRNLNNYIPGDNGLIFGPQGGFRVSAEGLSKFMIMLMNYGKFEDHRILDSSTVELMHTSQWKYNGNNGDNYHKLFNEWGLGTHMITNTANGDIIFDKVKMIGHAGNAYGLISDMYFEKGEKFGLIFITNGYAGSQEYASPKDCAFYKPEVEIFNLIKTYFYNDHITFLEKINKCKTENKLIQFNYDTSKLNLSRQLKNGILTIYTSSGRIIHQTVIDCIKMKLPDFMNNTYYMVVEKESKVICKKIIVKNKRK